MYIQLVWASAVHDSCHWGGGILCIETVYSWAYSCLVLRTSKGNLVVRIAWPIY